MTLSPHPRPLTEADLFALAQQALADDQSEVADAYFRALDARGQLPMAAAVRAMELEHQGDFDGAEAALRLGLARCPGHQDLICRLGRHRLREGDFAEGWALMEAREITISAQIRGRPRLSFPAWSGNPVSSLLVFGEQGLGDQIQFARYVPVLQARGVEVVFACAPPLMTLLEPLGVRMIPTVRGAALPRCDAWAMLMSLPHILGTTLDTLPPPAPLPGGAGGSGIGLVTRGNPLHANDANRTLPAEIAAELDSLPGVVSLHPDDTGVRDMAETAAIIADLAEVVTVDTSVAHLAGSMGKPCRILLPFAPDWRWLRRRRDSPWYPSATLYRQPRPGDWAPVIAAVREDIATGG